MTEIYKARIHDWHGEKWEEQKTAYDSADAAELCVERYINQSANYNAVDGDPVPVHVLEPDGTETLWHVRAYSSVSYRASHAEPAE